MTAREFEAWPHKAVTLLGMSGVGKTTLANRLPKSNWFHYSGDYRIGTRYLDEPIVDNIKRQAMQVDFLRDLLRSDSIYIKSNITVDNLQPVSTFLGKIGDPGRGGLSVEEFRRRQRLHHDAEVGAMKDVPGFIEKSRDIYGYDHFVNDAGGSVCEIEDASVVPILAEHTLILYLRADEALESDLLERQRIDPKPLYYPEAFFDAQLAVYLEERLNMPGLPELMQVLWQLGIYPNVEMMPSEARSAFESKEAAVDQVAGFLWVRPGSEEEERLRLAASELLEEDEDGVRIKGAKFRPNGLITWKKSGEPQMRRI